MFFKKFFGFEVFQKVWILVYEHDFAPCAFCEEGFDNSEN